MFRNEGADVGASAVEVHLRDLEKRGQDEKILDSRVKRKASGDRCIPYTKHTPKQAPHHSPKTCKNIK